MTTTNVDFDAAAAAVRAFQAGSAQQGEKLQAVLAEQLGNMQTVLGTLESWRAMQAEAEHLVTTIASLKTDEKKARDELDLAQLTAAAVRTGMRQLQAEHAALEAKVAQARKSSAGT